MNKWNQHQAYLFSFPYYCAFFVNPTPSEARAIFVGKSQGKVLQFPKWDEEDDDDTQVFQANVNMEKSLASYSKKYNSWTYLKGILKNRYISILGVGGIGMHWFLKCWIFLLWVKIFGLGWITYSIYQSSKRKQGYIGCGHLFTSFVYV